MATQYKKLKNKLTPKKDKPRLPERNVGKDYLLVSMIFFTVLIMIVAWSRFDNMNRALYIFLAISLSITYANRHARMTDTVRGVVEKLGWVSMAIATILFLILCYTQYIAD